MANAGTTLVSIIHLLLASSVPTATAQKGAPAAYEANNIGGACGSAKQSAHFRICGGTGGAPDTILKHLEAAHSCFTNDLGWKTHGLSKNGGAGPYKKLNVFAVGSLGSAAGQMFTDPRSGHSYVKVISRSLADPKVTVHEYGHSLTYYEGNWVDQKRTGAYWEPLANWFADTYMTSPLCAKARAKHGTAEGKTIIRLDKVLGQAHSSLVDASKGAAANYYEAWPFFTYITNNPDKFPGLGVTGVRDMIRKYRRGSNETPLHSLQIVAGSTKVQAIVGRYWARMAYMDIGHTQAQRAFQGAKARINYSNLDRSGSGYRVKANRAPKYMGANIIPLKGKGAITATVKSSGKFTATLAIKGGSAVRYVDLVGGTAKANIGANEEASLVVANTPALALYDPFSMTGEVARTLSYEVQLTGATA